MKKLKKEEKAPKLKFIDKNEPKAIAAVAKVNTKHGRK